MPDPTQTLKNREIDKIVSTPGRKGLTATSGSLESFSTKIVRENLKFDIENADKSTFKLFLHQALSWVNATVKSTDSSTDVEIQQELELCLTEVIRAMKENKNKTAMESINDQFNLYCKEDKEPNRYDPFVRATNTALQILETLKIGHAEAIDGKAEDNLVFFRHDPIEVRSIHKGKPYLRKPDVVCTSKSKVIPIYSTQKSPISKRTPMKKLLQLVPKPPAKFLPWKHHYLCVELKLGEKVLKVARPEYDENYIKAPLKEYKHDYSLEIVPDDLEDDAIAEASAPKNATSQVSEASSSQNVSEAPSSRSDTPQPVEASASSLENSLLEVPPTDDTDQQASEATALNNPPEATGVSSPSKSVHKVEGAYQCAENAAEMFYNTYGRAYVINLAINDEILHVWYFDHEGAVQTTGINFIQDKPYFFLFLFALQRFSLDRWGIISQLQPLNDDDSGPGIVNFDVGDDIPAPEKTTRTSPSPTFTRLGDIKKYQGFRHFGLAGRLTKVVYGKLSGQSGGRVLKITSRETSRRSEGTILRAAHNCLQGTDSWDYLPTLHGEKEYPEFKTDKIRMALRIQPKKNATRVPYVIILSRYKPFTEITKDWPTFLDHYMGLIHCHFKLWSIGIQHRDISLHNLMWDPDTKKPKLCDFDLSHFSRDHEPAGFTNTGTWMFMASELLLEDAIEGQVRHKYRHDLESYIAVWFWIMLHYNEGKKCVQDAKFKLKWNHSTPTACSMAREQTYRGIIDESIPCPPHIPSDLWTLAVGTLMTFREITRAISGLQDKKKSTQGKKFHPALAKILFKFSPEEQAQLDDFDSVKVIKGILEVLVHDSGTVHSSAFVKGIKAEIIKACGENAEGQITKIY